MSHSHGEIWSPDGQRLGWFEYNGTCDVVCTRVYKTTEDMAIHWRKDNIRQCQDEAGHQAQWQNVVLYTSYGWGFHWPGKVCWECQAVVDGIFPTDPFTGDTRSRDGHPFFDARMLADYGKILPCPACGGKLASLIAGEKRIAPIMCEGCKKGFYSWDLEEMCQTKKRP